MNTLLFITMISSLIWLKNNDRGKDSAKEPEVHQTTMSPEELIALNPKPGYCNISFQEYHNMQPDTFPSSINFLGGFYSKSARVNISVNAEIFVSGTRLTKASDFSNYYYNIPSVDARTNIYGKKIRFQTNILTSPAFSISDSIYVPKMIQLNYPGYRFMGTDSSKVVEASQLSIGQTITWNEDHANLKGFYLYLEYSSGWDGNGILRSSNDYTVTNWVAVDDDGSYKLDAKLFDKIPHNAAIRLVLVRGNYITVTNSLYPEKDFMIFGYSVQEGMFKYIKQ